MLRHFVSPSQDDWELRPPCCEFAINNAWNQSTGSTPFFLNYGENPRSPVNVDVVCKLPAADTLVGRIKTAIANARDSLLYAQRRMCKSYDAKHREESFAVGEFVYLSPTGLLLSVAGSKKLSSRMLGPFEVTERIGRLAYRLLLPESMSKVHPVFHVSLLKRPKDGGRGSAPPPAMLLDGQEECEIDKVLSHRQMPHKNQPNHREYLVSWRGMGPEEREPLSKNKLHNAADVVQEYLDGLQAQGRQAPRVGAASADLPEHIDSAGQPGNTVSQKKKPGRPPTQRHTLSAKKTVSKRRSSRLRAEN